MPSKPFPSDVLKQAQEVSNALTRISSTLAFGTLNAAALTADITSLTSIQSQIAVLELQLTDLRNQREAVSVACWDKVKRFRSGVKASYGDDSSQFELIGGTRTSDRKSPVRKTTTE